MNNPIVMYENLLHAIEFKEFELALIYAENLDEIVGYKYYVNYVNEKIKKYKNSKIKRK